MRAAAPKPVNPDAACEGHGMIPEGHALQTFFLDLVRTHYSRDIGLRDEQVSAYVANMLTEFTEMERLQAIQNSAGRRLDDVGEMLLEADPVFGEAPSFDRERQVRKHIGDYTLFFTGMFPEAINHSRLRRSRLENLVDFIRAGKESYYIVSKFEYFEYAKVAPLFAKLAAHFEECVYGLNQIKNELAERQHPIMRETREFIM
jgi:hypothetical protein